MSTLEPIPIFGKKLMLSQLQEGFKTTTDSILLSAACLIEDGQNVLDMGCGVGGAGLCIAKRLSNVQLTGVDIQADHIEIAKQNAEHNQIDATFIEKDIRDYESKGRFDHVICNPPYLDAGSYIPSPYLKKAIATGHIPSPRRERAFKGMYYQRLDHGRTPEFKIGWVPYHYSPRRIYR